MSRIGKLPIQIPEGVKIELENQKMRIFGPKGELETTIPSKITVRIENNQVICEASKKEAAIWGLSRTLINNAIIGVSQGWIKTLELVGVGFRANKEGEDLILNVGFSHPVRVKAPAGITFNITENKIQVLGCDRQLVGETAARIRKIRLPEPYKGKGIRYQGEKIRRKVGKTAKAIGAVGTGGKA